MAADKCKENEGSLIGEDLEIFRTEYVDKEIERIYPNLSPHLPRKQKLHLNVFNGEDLEIAIDKATQWQKEQIMKDAVEIKINRDTLYDLKPLIHERYLDYKIGQKVKIIILPSDNK